MRLALASVNPTVGDIPGNEHRILEAIARASPPSRPCDAILLPELVLSGYPPMDLLHREGFVDACLASAHRIAQAISPDVTAILGLPMRAPTGPGLTNSLAVLHRGTITHRYDKQLLPTYDVFDEDRYFESGTTPLLLDIVGLRVGLTICEDLWMGQDAGFASKYRHLQDPVLALVRAGARAILSASASPFVLGKGHKHRAILASHAQRHHVPVASVNQLGANDELVFDGHRYVFAQDGALALAGNLFDDRPLVLELNHAGHLQAPTPAPNPAPPPAGTLHTAPDEEHLFHALVLGVRDYLRKTGFKQALLGLSGGIDSALTAAIAVAAIGPVNVLGIAMPGPYSSDHSVSDAQLLATNLAMRCELVPIVQPMQGFRAPINDAFRSLAKITLGEALPDLTEENLQSRIRGTLLMAISNRTGAIVLTTGNKSEMAVGYCTLYGDMNGGLAVLSDVSKQRVYALSKFINQHFARLPGLTHCPAPPIPEGTLTKPPSAELRPDQTDQDSLPPYDVLDEILARFVEQGQSPATIARETAFDPALVAKITRMIDLAEYKRRQAALGLKVTSVAFGTGRRMPVAQSCFVPSKSAPPTSMPHPPFSR